MVRQLVNKHVALLLTDQHKRQQPDNSGWRLVLGIDQRGLCEAQVSWTTKDAFTTLAKTQPGRVNTSIAKSHTEVSRHKIELSFVPRTLSPQIDRSWRWSRVFPEIAPSFRATGRHPFLFPRDAFDTTEAGRVASFRCPLGLCACTEVAMTCGVDRYCQAHQSVPLEGVHVVLDCDTPSPRGAVL